MYATFQLEKKKFKGKFPCKTYAYVGESTEKIPNKIGLGRIADRAQRQGLENIPLRFCFLDRAFSIMKTKINQRNAQINSG